MKSQHLLTRLSWLTVRAPQWLKQYIVETAHNCSLRQQHITYPPEAIQKPPTRRIPHCLKECLQLPDLVLCDPHFVKCDIQVVLQPLNMILLLVELALQFQLLSSLGSRS